MKVRSGVDTLTQPEPGSESRFRLRNPVVPDWQDRPQRIDLNIAVFLADDLRHLVAERPVPPGDPSFSEPPEDALETDPHESDGGSALGRAEDLRQSLYILFVDRIPPVVLNGQGITLVREPERDGTSAGIQRVLHQLEYVDPTMLEGQLECAQCPAAVRRSVERLVVTSELLDEISFVSFLHGLSESYLSRGVHTMQRPLVPS